MPNLDLLYIYDATIDFAEERDDASMTIAHKGDIVALAKILRDLVDKGNAFRRCVFTTHGAPGNILFNGDQVDAGGLTKRCAGQNLHLLFPHPASRLYFNGCEVGAEPGGKKFVTTAAQIFLRAAGGEAFAMTSNGHPYPLPWFHKGHVMHIGGGVVSTQVGPGGTVIPDPPPVVQTGYGRFQRDNVGNKI
jgi:hypothetical protein